MRQPWTNGILGLWLALAPFISMDVPSVKLNNILVGLIVAAVNWYVPKEWTWQRWTAMILGAWIFVAGFIPGLAGGSDYVWSNLISGLLIAISGFTGHGKSPAAKHA